MKAFLTPPLMLKVRRLRLYPPSLARQRSKTSLWPVLVTGAPTATRDYKTNFRVLQEVSSTIVDRALCVD